MSSETGGLESREDRDKLEPVKPVAIDCLRPPIEEESPMLKKSLIVAAAILFAASAFAQSPAKKSAPGQQAPSATTGPGASENTPGHKMKTAKKAGKYTGKGASKYAPGHQTTTGSAATKKK